MPKDELTAESSCESIDHKISADAEEAHKVCYETLASQAELYLEEVEEEVHTELDSYDRSHIDETRTKQTLEWLLSVPDPNNDPCPPENLDGQTNHAAEELITGDSDDPALSKDTFLDILGMI